MRSAIGGLLGFFLAALIGAVQTESTFPRGADWLYALAVASLAGAILLTLTYSLQASELRPLRQGLLRNLASKAGFAGFELLGEAEDGGDFWYTYRYTTSGCRHREIRPKEFDGKDLEDVTVQPGNQRVSQAEVDHRATGRQIHCRRGDITILRWRPDRCSFLIDEGRSSGDQIEMRFHMVRRVRL